MGTWGTGISSNDFYADIYATFFDYYNEGFEVSDISEKLIAESQCIIEDPHHCNNFWFALAKAQWECKQLDPELFLRVKEIIDTEADLEVWRQCGANEKYIKKRKIVLDKFLLDLQREKTNAKKRKKKIIRQPVFEKGDCLTFKLENGNYGGAVVLESIADEYGHNLFATTRINQATKPTKEDFEKSEILLVYYESYDDIVLEDPVALTVKIERRRDIHKPAIFWWYPVRRKDTSHPVEKIASIVIDLEYSHENHGFYGYVASLDNSMIEVANRQFHLEKTKPLSTNKLTIRELTKKKKSRWWF